MSLQRGEPRLFVTLGMFIIDEFSFQDEQGLPTGKVLPPQIGGGGTYAIIGSRIWLPAENLGMIIDRGSDFPNEIGAKLAEYGRIWHYREREDNLTARAMNTYRGDHRGFEYLTPRIRISPHDLEASGLERPKILHFICSPKRAAAIMSEINDVGDWVPTVIYEPIPYHCVPEQLQALLDVLPSISILSPNAEEALSLLSLPQTATKELIEHAASQFLEYGVGQSGTGCVVIRSGSLGAFVKTRRQAGRWIDAFWSKEGSEGKVVDVTGAGNSFLGGFAAGLILTQGDVFEASLYGSISASFIIEQEGLPTLTRKSDSGANVTVEEWNGESPASRLEELRERSKIRHQAY